MASSSLFVIFMLLSCGITMSHQAPQDELRGCGERLADIMALVCKGRGYNSLFPDSSRSGMRSRRTPGIVDECCYNTCGVKIMRQYCAPLTTESPDNTQIRKRSDSYKDWSIETNSEGTEVLTFRPRSVVSDKFQNQLYGINTERGVHLENAESTNLIKKLTVSDTASRTRHEKDSAMNLLIKKLKGSSGEVKINSGEKCNFSENNQEKCNSVSGCRSRGRSRDVSFGIDRRDLDARGPPSMDKTRSGERSSGEVNRIRHRNHKNSSRERKTLNEHKQSKVGTLTPFYQQKGLVQPILKSPRLVTNLS